MSIIKSEDLKEGHVYYLVNHTAPKVLHKGVFICLLTDQKFRKGDKAEQDLGHINKWKKDIYKPERFDFK